MVMGTVAQHYGSVARSYPAPGLADSSVRAFADPDVRPVTLEELGEQLVASVGKNTRPREPYRQIAAFYGCVRAVAEAVKNMPFNVATRDDELVESGDVIDLVNCPYPGLTGEDFWDLTVAHLMTRGCYWVAQGWKPGAAIARIEPAGGDRCEPKYDRVTGELTHYRYRPMTGGQWVELPPEAVEPVIVPDIHADGLYDALPPIKPAETALYQISGADQANVNALDNSGEPGMVFEMGDEPDEKVKRDFRAQVRERFRDPANRNLPIVLWGNSKLHSVVRKFVEMEFSRLKQMSIIDVCIVCRTPPQVIGYGTADKLNPGEDSKAHKVWIENTVLPLGYLIARKFTLFALSTYQRRAEARALRHYVPASQRSFVDLRSPGYRAMRSWARRQRVAVSRHNAVLGREAPSPENLTLFGYFDSTSVQSVQEAMYERAERAVLLSEKLGVPQAEVIDTFDLPVTSDHPWQAFAYKTMGMVPYGEPAPGDDDPDGSMPAESDPEEAGGDDTPQTPTAEDEGERKTPRPWRSVSAAVEVRAMADLWRAWRASWKGLEDEASASLGDHFGGLADAVLRRLADNAETIDALAEGRAAVAGTVTARAAEASWDRYWDGVGDRGLGFTVREDAEDLIARIVFTLAEADRKIVAASTAIFSTAFRLGGEQSVDEHAGATGQDGDDLPGFQIDNARARRALRTRQIKVRGTNRTFRERLRRQLLEGFSRGETQAQLARRVRGEKAMSLRRAKSIAMTEVGAAVEQGRHEGRRQMGVPKKSWIWSQRETARGWHRQTSDATVAAPIPNDEAFVLAVTGHRAQHPRDASLPASETVHCGCFVVGRYDNDDFNQLTAQTTERGFLTVERMTQRVTRRAA